jgi:hypothetical protein
VPLDKSECVLGWNFLCVLPLRGNRLPYHVVNRCPIFSFLVRR